MARLYWEAISKRKYGVKHFCGRGNLLGSGLRNYQATNFQTLSSQVLQHPHAEKLEKFSQKDKIEIFFDT